MSNNTTKKFIKSISRRKAMKLALAAGTILVAPAYIRSAKAKSRNLVVVNSGGTMGNARRAALYDPFTAATGIETTSLIAFARCTKQPCFLYMDGMVSSFDP